MNPEQGCILLIEDNPSDADIILHVLQKCAVAQYVRVLQDGEEALQYLFNSSQEKMRPPDLIILDLKLPKVGGIEVLHQLRNHEETAGIPVVVFSSSGEERDIQEAQRYGVERYIVKSVNFSAFREEIEEIAEYWRQLTDRCTPPGSTRGERCSPGG
jgi:two-component system response regulator